MWAARPGSDDKYFALFNLDDKKENVKFIFEWDMLRGDYQIRDLWEHQDLVYRMTPR